MSTKRNIAQQELRSEMIDKVNSAIGAVRDLVSQLNEDEKDYLHYNSEIYRQLVDTIRNWNKK